jgi:hypothetical protein
VIKNSIFIFIFLLCVSSYSYYPVNVAVLPILRLVCLADNVDGGVDVDVLIRVESDNRFTLRKERRLFNLLSLL